MSSASLITLQLTPALAQLLLQQLKLQLQSQTQLHEDDAFAEEDPHWRDHLPQPF